MTRHSHPFRMADRPSGRAAAGRWAKKPGSTPSTAPTSASKPATTPAKPSASAKTRAPIVIAGAKKTDPSPQDEDSTASGTGGLWNKMKAMAVGASDEPSLDADGEPIDPENAGESSGLWSKIKNATAAIKEKLEEVDSDDTDHEGTTHVVRVLSDYYRQKEGDVPDWILRPGTPPDSNRRRQEQQRAETMMKKSEKVSNTAAFKPLARSTGGGGGAFKPMSKTSSNQSRSGEGGPKFKSMGTR